jgi:antitoxin component YwqK of YwqJK toxin-antitoxin module
MKKVILIFLFIICKVGLAQSSAPKGKDSLAINHVDDQGKKQGPWKILGEFANLPDYAPKSIVEEGKYNNSLKVGVWKHYFPSGVLQNKLTYENNRPNGYAIMYHENGKISEEGNWKNNRWVGNYKLYYDNGNVQQEFTFNETGKREGPQIYNYENGQRMIEGNWKEGHEDGLVKEFYENGDPKADKIFDGGNLNTEKTTMYSPKKAMPEKKAEVVVDPKIDTHVKESDQNLGGSGTKAAPVSVGLINGTATIYNKDRQVSKIGTFVNGKMISGKVYIYNGNGILTRIAVYENNNYKGDAPIEE